jgi:hypothetical protein
MVIIQESSWGLALLNYSLEEYEWDTFSLDNSQPMRQLTSGQSAVDMKVSNLL